MSNLDQVWAATSADSEYGDNVEPPAGWLGIVQLTGARAGKSKKGEMYMAVDLKSQDGQFNWPIYKAVTTNGLVVEGKVKSAKITLRQLGVDPNTPFGQVEAALRAKVGTWYSVEQKASDRISTTTGAPFVNTEVLGAASPPAPAPTVQAPVNPQPGQTLDQALQAQVPAQTPAAAMQAQVQQAVAAPQDNHPFN